MVDPGREAGLKVLLDDLARDVADVLVADAGVVGTLRRGIAVFRESERTAVLVEEVLLFESEPGAGVVEDGGALVRGMRGLAVRHHDFAHHQRAILALAVRIDGDRLENAVRASALGLHCGTAIEAPERQLLQGRKSVELLDLRLSAQVGRRGIPIKPDVLELVLGHCVLSTSLDEGQNPTRRSRQNYTGLAAGAHSAASIERANANQRPERAKRERARRRCNAQPRCRANSHVPSLHISAPFAADIVDAAFKLRANLVL